MLYGKHKLEGTDTLNVVKIGRVSTMHQQVTNIEAGYRYVDNVLKQIHDGPMETKKFGEQNSGMLVERETIMDAWREIASSWAHVVAMEDVSKSYRNPRWIYAFVQDCVDAGVRVIAPGDNVDTWDEGWEVALATAALRHGLHIPDTRRRVRRTATDSFKKGGMVSKVRFGYRKLSKEEADSGQFGRPGLRVMKLVECTVIILRMFHMVMIENKEYEAVADWLNRENIRPGPYVRNGLWTGKLVEDFLRDPILCGWRSFREYIHEYVYRTGEHKRKVNDNPERCHEPDLAHVTEEEWQKLQLHMDARAAAHRQPQGRKSRRHRVPRSRSIAPAQMVVCGACTEMMHQFGIDVIKCQNAHHRENAGPCWNHVQVPCELTRQMLIDMLLAKVDVHPHGRKVLIEASWQEIEHSRHRSGRKGDELDRRIKELEGQAKRLAKAIAVGGKLEALIEEAAKINGEMKKLKTQRKKLEEIDTSDHLPNSMQALEIDPRDALLVLARTSFDFADLMRRIITSFVIRPVQALDTPLVRPRAYITLDLAALVPGAASEPEQIVLDLFEPPVHIKHMPAVLTAKATLPRPSLSRIVDHLRIGRMTVKRALGYARLMEAAGMTEPYRELHEAPAQASRWKARKPREDAA